MAIGQMWHTIRHASGAWQPQYGLIESQEQNDPGSFGEVGCAGVTNELHVVGITSDGQMWHTIRQADGAWQPQFGLVEGQEQNNPGVFRDVGCAGVTSDLHVVGITSDGQMWHTIRHATGAWFPRYVLVEGQLQNDPGEFTDVGCAGVASDLHVVGITSDGQMWHTIRHPIGKWQEFNHIVGPPGETMDCGGCAGVANELEVVATTTGSDQMWHTIRNSDGTWQPFSQIEAQEHKNFFGAACAGVAGELQVVGCTSDGQMLHTIKHADQNWQPFGLVESQEQNDPGQFTDLACAGVADELQVVGVTGPIFR